MSRPGRPSAAVFAVEDTTVQFTWRNLPVGSSGVRVVRADGSGPVVEPAVVEVDGPGARVVHDLPPATDLVLEVDVGAGRDRTTLRAPFRTLDALPGAELVRVGTVGDLHLGTEVFGQQGTIREEPAPAEPHPIRCARAALWETAAWGARHVVAKGDLTNHGQVREWRTYAELVRQAPTPVDAVPGNHDRAAGQRAVGLSPEDAARVFGLSIATEVVVRDLPGLRLVLLDSTTGGWSFGHVEPFADAVVTAVAEADPAGAVLVALHHQLQPHRLSEGWPIGVSRDESVRLLDRLGRAHPHVLVTSGHTHRHRRWDHGGVVATQVGSTKDYPGVWAGYVVHEGGLRQVVRRVEQPDCVRWTEHTRRAAFGVWRWVSPGLRSARCFNQVW